MNFLAHYYFDKKEVSNPPFHLGLVFPDFIKTFTGQRFKLDSIQQNDQLHLGALKHIERDAHFHNHAFFDEICKKISATLKQTAAKSIPKTFFLSHILAEIAIDRVLIEDDISHLENFYFELENVDKKALSAYFTQNNIQHYETFIQKLDTFTLNKWMFKYLEDDKLPFSLNRVYFRIGYNQEWNKEQNTAIIEALPTILTEVRKALPSYLA